jgi:acyl carrier protein
MDTIEFMDELGELFELDSGEISKEDALTAIPGWDSLTFLGLIALIDERYGFTISPDEVLKCATINDLILRIAAEQKQHRDAA